MMKITVNLPESDVEFVQQLANIENESFTYILQRGIGLLQFIDKRKIIAEYKDGKLREMVWR